MPTVKLLREEHPGIAQGLSVSLLAWLSFSMLPTRGCLGFSEVEGLLILVSDAYGLAVVQGVWRFSLSHVPLAFLLESWALAPRRPRFQGPCRFSMRKALLCKMRVRSGPRPWQGPWALPTSHVSPNFYRRQSLRFSRPFLSTVASL